MRSYDAGRAPTCFITLKEQFLERSPTTILLATECNMKCGANFPDANSTKEEDRMPSLLFVARRIESHLRGCL
jgi:hypothetical protein